MEQKAPLSHEPEVAEDDVTLQPVTDEPKKKSFPFVMGGVFVVLVLLGVGTGYLLSRSTAGIALPGQSAGYVKTEKVAGVTDTKTFKDSAEGTIQKGGIDGEGTHKLVRQGGDSQTAYLVSSVINLDDYEGKHVKVWGETFAAQKAAWLMDVGKIEVLQ